MESFLSLAAFVANTVTALVPYGLEGWGDRDTSGLLHVLTTHAHLVDFGGNPSL